MTSNHQSPLSMAEERIAFLQRAIIARDAEIQSLSKLSVDLREDYLHMMRRVGHVYDLLSGEFFNEALGELNDVLNGGSQRLGIGKSQ